MDKKLTVSPYGNAKDDLFYWIRSYIASKVYSIKEDKEYNINRAEFVKQLLNTNNIEEFDLKQREIRNKGLSTLISYVNPLIGLYDYFCETTDIQQITDFNTEHRDRIFLEKNKDYSYSTNLGHFVQIGSLLSHIEKTLSTTRDAEEYTFDIVNKVENGKCVYPFSKNKNKLNYIKPDEIIRLITMVDTFNYRGEALSKIKLMLKFSIFGGLSSTQLIHLTKKNIRIVKNPHQLLEGLYLELQIKYPKEVVVYIKYSLIVEEYASYNLEYHDSNHKEIFFYTENGEMYSSSSIHQQFRRLMIHANIEYGNAIHSILRYSYVVFLASNDVDLEIVLLLFGDRSQITNPYYESKITTIYHETLIEDLRNNPSQIVACWENF